MNFSGSLVEPAGWQDPRRRASNGQDVIPTRVEYLHMPQWQKVLFYVLIAISLAIMGAQIWQRVRLWRQGKPIDWKPRPIENVLKYVLGQFKVQTSRPKSGAPMHLMIFYGFLALFVATTLLAINSYGPIKFHQGTYYLVYEMTFDLLGLLFIVGVGWAMGRRWLARPRVVSNAPSDSWVLWLLMALGVTGYVLEAARMVNDPKPWDWSAPVGFALSKGLPDISNGGYLAIWWFHAILVMVFFITLPKMRIRHIVMATFSTAGHPDQAWGRLKPISMEEVEETGKIGVTEAKDYSRWHLLSLDACMECGRCTEVCPAWNVGKILNPKHVVLDTRRANETGQPVAEAVTEEALWACTTCNACVEACPVLIRHVDLIVDARRGLVAEGRLAGSGAVMLRQVGSTSNAWGAPASQREDWMKGLDVPLCRDGVEFDYLFWVGCAGATDPGAIRTTKAVAEILSKAGIKYACLGKEEACTGDPARRVGDEFLFQDKAQGNVSVFQKYGVKKIVTACPHCFNTFRNEYGEFGAEIEVFHHSQLIGELIDEGKLKPAQPAKGDVTYHDPCYLARVNLESDAPRKALGDETNLNEMRPLLAEAAATPPGGLERNLAEPTHHGRKTLCCGAGGGRMWMDEPPNQRPAVRRAQELVDTGAKTVALGCPFCRIMLDASLKQVTEDEINLVDLAEMVRDANRS